MCRLLILVFCISVVLSVALWKIVEMALRNGHDEPSIDRKAADDVIMAFIHQQDTTGDTLEKTQRIEPSSEDKDKDE